MAFILILFIVACVFGIRWAVKSSKKAKEKAKADWAKASDLMYGETLDLTPTSTAMIDIIQCVAKSKPADIERLLTWADTLKYPLKGNVLKIIQVALN